MDQFKTIYTVSNFEMVISKFHSHKDSNNRFTQNRINTVQKNKQRLAQVSYGKQNFAKNCYANFPVSLLQQDMFYFAVS